MAVRNDIVVDFSTSPRIITIVAPSTTITIQDLHDTLRTIEAYPWNSTYLHLVNSFGKQDLGGGVLVGITLVLQNVQLAFAARGGPTWVQCTINGGNFVAIDDIGDSLYPIYQTNFVTVSFAQSSSATLIQDAAEWTQTEKDNLISTNTNIPTNVWSNIAINNLTTIGSIGKKLVDVLKLKRTHP